ncbi:MAG: heavy-metal-associated domain-containing protein [Candidatus Komeilibacteria bacterium]
MPTINVVNIKCGGCAAGIKDKLSKNGFSNIEVSPDEQTVSFDGDEVLAEKILAKMGYPKAGTKEAANLIKKAKSYISCMIGKTHK